jgi:hypothetical protein
MNTGPLPTFGYPPAGGRRYMANGPLPWLTHFSQQDAPGFAWRSENTKRSRRHEKDSQTASIISCFLKFRVFVFFLFSSLCEINVGIQSSNKIP